MAAPTDRVQVYIQESPSGGGTEDEMGYQKLADPTEDAIEVHGVWFQPPGGPLDELAYITRDGAGNVVFKDANQAEVSLTTLAAAGSGISEAQHEALDTLTHDLTETHNVVITRSSGKVVSVLMEETGGTDIRLLEVLTRTSGKVATYRLTQYEGDGTTVKRQLDGTINRSGGNVTSVNVVRTV